MATPTKKPVEKKAEKAIAVVLEASHGFFFNRHRHIITNVIQSDEITKEEIEETTIEAIEIAKKLFPEFGVRLLSVSEVQIVKPIKSTKK